MPTTIRLSENRRTAFRQLEAKGFRIEQGKGGEVKLIAPDGMHLGGFSIPKRNRHTPRRLLVRVNQWKQRPPRRPRHSKRKRIAEQTAAEVREA